MTRRWFAKRQDIPEDVPIDRAETARRERNDTREEIRKREISRREVEIASKTETLKALKDAGYASAADTVDRQLTHLVSRVAELVDEGEGDNLEKELLEVRLRALYGIDEVEG